MKMKMASKKWATPRQRRCLKKLVDHVSSHYPKDAGLRRAVKQALGVMDEAAKTMKKAAKKAPRRRKAVRSTRRRATRRAAATRRTARSAAPRRATRRSPARRRATRRA